MLVFAAEFFPKMFKGYFKEAVESSAEFPDDDPDAWKFLVEWCYEGRLSSITRSHLLGQTKCLTKEETTTCWTRLNLCCLAEKYDMVLLQNLAMDSIISYFRASSRPGPKLKWAVLKKWILRVYENTPESSKIRKFMSRFFHYGLRFSKTGLSTEMRQQPNSP